MIYLPKIHQHSFSGIPLFVLPLNQNSPKFRHAFPKFPQNPPLTKKTLVRYIIFFTAHSYPKFQFTQNFTGISSISFDSFINYFDLNMVLQLIVFDQNL